MKKTYLKTGVLIRVLARRNESVPEFADTVRASKNAVYRWLDGSRNPRPLYRRRMIRVLKMRFGQLFEVR